MFYLGQPNSWFLIADVVLILDLCSGGQKFLFDHTDCNASVVKDCFSASFKKNIQDLYFKLIKMNWTWIALQTTNLL